MRLRDLWLAGLSAVLAFAGTASAGCPLNAAAGRPLCASVAAPAQSVDIGSPDGRFAFLVSDGAPRIIEVGKAKPVWTASLRIPPSYPCLSYAATFTTAKSLPTIRLNCQGTVFAAMDVTSSIRPAAISISNNGTITFAAANGTIVASIALGRPTPARLKFTKIKDPKPFPPSALNTPPMWMTMPDSWCNEVVWVRKSKGAVQCEKNTAPNAAQNKDPIENCVYRYRCVINPDTPSGCDYGNGYLGNDGYRPPALGKLEWFTLIPAGAPIKYSKEISDFWPVKELAWLAVNNGSCGRMCPMPSVQWFIKDYKVDCSWEAGGGAKRKEKGGLALDASRAFLKQ